MPKSYLELKAEHAALNAEIDRKRDEAYATIRQLMQEFGFQAWELDGRRRPNRPIKKKGPLPAKFRDPVSGLTWSGRGKQPDWMVEERDHYAIERWNLDKA